MRHYYNRQSKRNFCELKLQPKSNNFAVRGSVLGNDNEIYCLECVYRKEQIAPQSNTTEGEKDEK